MYSTTPPCETVQQPKKFGDYLARAAGIFWRSVFAGWLGWICYLAWPALAFFRRCQERGGGISRCVTSRSFQEPLQRMVFEGLAIPFAALFIFIILRWVFFGVQHDSRSG